MVVTRLGCQNFRNLRDGELFPCPGVNVIYGGNAQGKTNLLEGLWLFTGGHSFRGAKDVELPRLDTATGENATPPPPPWPWTFSARAGSRRLCSSLRTAAAALSSMG